MKTDSAISDSLKTFLIIDLVITAFIYIKWDIEGLARIGCFVIEDEICTDLERRVQFFD